MGGGKIAVCLLSGGMDSAVTAAVCRSQGYEIFGLTFDYGQKNKREVNSAKKIAKWLNSGYEIFKIDLQKVGCSALTSGLEIPTNRSLDEIRNLDDIPITYVPGRNTIFLSIALAYAEAIGAGAIFIGSHRVDYSGYPDCRPEFLEKFQELAALGTKSGIKGKVIEIIAPLMNMDKAAIIKKGIKLGVPFEHTWSCYSGGEKACGRCDSCILRLNGFKEAGFKDPIKYKDEIQNQ